MHINVQLVLLRSSYQNLTMGGSLYRKSVWQPGYFFAAFRSVRPLSLAVSMMRMGASRVGQACPNGMNGIPRAWLTNAAVIAPDLPGPVTHPGVEPSSLRTSCNFCWNSSGCMILFIVILWCPTRDSNSHGLRRRFLKPLCLPIPPIGLVRAAGLEPATSGFQTRHSTN